MRKSPTDTIPAYKQKCALAQKRKKKLKGLVVANWIRISALATLSGALIAAAPAVADQDQHNVQESRDMPQISLTTSDGQMAIATLADNATTKAFLSLLPLTISMGDHFARELYGSLPQKITTAGGLTKTYKAGDIVYWPPGPGFAIYYKVSGPTIPGDGIAYLGSIDTGVEIFSKGATEVTLDLVK